MAYKQFLLNEQMVVTVYKRRSSRNIRLSVGADGKTRVSIPLWLPYRAGLAFAQKQIAWIAKQQQPPVRLTDGQAVGKAHHLHFVLANNIDKPQSRIGQTEIRIKVPLSMSADSAAVQELAKKACVRALRGEAQKLLPQRLATLAEQHGFQYNSVTIKQLRSRWGSCDRHNNIVLNLYLMQVPWESIDYVLLHELMHTKLLHHGPVFWEAMEEILPDVKRRRAHMKSFQPVLHAPLASSL